MFPLVLFHSRESLGVWQVWDGRLSGWVESLGERGRQDFDGFELQKKSQRTVCLALFWHSELFWAHKTMITMKWPLCQWSGGKMVVCFCLCVCLCLSLNMLMCVPRCFVNCSLCLYCVSCLQTVSFYVRFFFCDCCHCVNSLHSRTV